MCIRDSFIPKTGVMTTCVETYTTYSIVYGIVVTMCPIHFKGIPMAYPSWMVCFWLFHSYPKRILRIQIQYPVVFNIDLRNPIVSGGKKKAIIKTNFYRSWFEQVIP